MYYIPLNTPVANKARDRYYGLRVGDIVRLLPVYSLGPVPDEEAEVVELDLMDNNRVKVKFSNGAVKHWVAEWCALQTRIEDRVANSIFDRIKDALADSKEMSSFKFPEGFTAHWKLEFAAPNGRLSPDNLNYLADEVAYRIAKEGIICSRVIAWHDSYGDEVMRYMIYVDSSTSPL